MATCSNCAAETTGAFCSACGTPVAAPPPTAPLAPPPPPPIAPTSAPPFAAAVVQPPAEYATWLRRVAGSVIDGLVFGIPFSALMIAGFIWGLSTVHWRCITQPDGSSSCHTLPGSTFSVGGGILIGLAVLWGIAWTIYVLIAIGGTRGATVGMRAVGIRCVRDTTFDQVGMGKSFLRLLVTWLLQIIWIGSMIDDLFPLWDPKRQTLHDKAVETVVLRTSS